MAVRPGTFSQEVAMITALVPAELVAAFPVPAGLRAQSPILHTVFVPDLVPGLDVRVVLSGSGASATQGGARRLLQQAGHGQAAELSVGRPVAHFWNETLNDWQQVPEGVYDPATGTTSFTLGVALMNSPGFSWYLIILEKPVGTRSLRRAQPPEQEAGFGAAATVLVSTAGLFCILVPLCVYAIRRVWGTGGKSRAGSGLDAAGAGLDMRAGSGGGGGGGGGGGRLDDMFAGAMTGRVQDARGFGMPSSLSRKHN